METLLLLFDVDEVDSLFNQPEMRKNALIQKIIAKLASVYQTNIR